MIDPRVTQLANVLCNHSTALTPEDNVLVYACDIPDEAAAEVVRVAQTSGAKVVVRMESNIIKRQLLKGMTVPNAQLIADVEKHEMEQMTAYIALRGSNNYAEMSDVPEANQSIWTKEFMQPVHFGVRIPKTKWVALVWPTSSMAQQASMSTAAFEDFYFRVCTLDYKRMQKASEPLVELIAKTEKVELKGPGTDLTFSIAGIGAVSCHGERNIPDGECYTAPVRESMQGVVTYNCVSLNQGVEFKNIKLTVKDGKIVEADAGVNSAKLNEILDTDEGARYFGEWSFGYNPHILHPMKNTLFDEKIAGSFHLTPGAAYPGIADNGNRSAVHWDIVNIQRPDYGGGEIWFDGKLIRKDGLFAVPELEGLNPERLGA